MIFQHENCPHRCIFVPRWSALEISYFLHCLSVCPSVCLSVRVRQQGNCLKSRNQKDVKYRAQQRDCRHSCYFFVNLTTGVALQERFSAIWKTRMESWHCMQKVKRIGQPAIDWRVKIYRICTLYISKQRLWQFDSIEDVSKMLTLGQGVERLTGYWMSLKDPKNKLQSIICFLSNRHFGDGRGGHLQMFIIVTFPQHYLYVI